MDIGEHVEGEIKIIQESYQYLSPLRNISSNEGKRKKPNLHPFKVYNLATGRLHHYQTI